MAEKVEEARAKFHDALVAWQHRMISDAALYAHEDSLIEAVRSECGYDKARLDFAIQHQAEFEYIKSHESVAIIWLDKDDLYRSHTGKTGREAVDRALASRADDEGGEGE